MTIKLDIPKMNWKFPNFNKQLAWHTTQTVLISVGAVETASFVASLQWWLMIVFAGMIAAIWTFVYKLLEGFSVRKLDKEIVVTGGNQE